MKDIFFIKNEKELIQYRIREAFMADGFRVLIDDYRYGKKDGVMVADDGKSDRVFKTEAEALKKITDTAYKYMSIKYIDSYIVKEV